MKWQQVWRTLEVTIDNPKLWRTHWSIPSSDRSIFFKDGWKFCQLFQSGLGFWVLVLLHAFLPFFRFHFNWCHLSIKVTSIMSCNHKKENKRTLIKISRWLRSMTSNPIFMCTQLLLYFNQESRDSTVYALFCLNRLVGVLLFGFFQKLDKNSTNTFSNFSKESLKVLFQL